jgi:hypothetical protein
MPDSLMNALILWDVNCSLYALFFGLGVLWNEVNFSERMKRLAVIFWQSGFKVGKAIVPRPRDDWWRFKRGKKP